MTRLTGEHRLVYRADDKEVKIGETCIRRPPSSAGSGRRRPGSPGHLPVAVAWGRQQYTQPIPVINALIAATAQVHGMAVVTRTVKDFELAGVRTLIPFAE